MQGPPSKSRHFLPIFPPTNPPLLEAPRQECSILTSPSTAQTVSRGHDYDSSDAESANEDELVTGFDRFGVQRLLDENRLNGEKKAAAKPLVIPALKNKDWRELARKRRGAPHMSPFRCCSDREGWKRRWSWDEDTINSGPVLSGLQVKTRTLLRQDGQIVYEEEDIKMEVVEEETEDQKALRAILAESSGEVFMKAPVIDIIPTPVSEEDALKQDVEELPDVATLEDYARVPVSQFGAALLRGMGWKEGTAATRKPGKGLVEPYIPAARPALLGIGAKEQEVYDDGSKKNSKSRRPERRYVPIIRQERADTGSPSGGSRDRRERSRSPRRSATSSRRASPDRHETSGSSSRRRYDDDRDVDMDKRRSDDRDRRRNDDREKERDRGRDQDRDRRRGDDRDRRRDDGRDRPERKDCDSSKRKRDY
ncbi:DExH-box splicing factor binding site-domain-containing protein [Flammula alnicola]|nr:DExH-box splicing factor binding site-domain-containing protein [Flammula alnicola]